MINLKRKSIIGAVVVAIVSSCFIFGFASIKSVKAEKAEFPENVLQDVYRLNDELTLPASITVTHGGIEYELKDGAVTYPDGIAYNKDAYTLDELGDYNVSYALKTDDYYLTAEKNFTVINGTFEVTSKFSTAEYKNLTTEFAKNTGNQKGIVLSLASGDTFNYNIPIDLSKKSLNDLITLYTPQIADEADVGNIVVRLTDCYDSSIYTDFVLWFEAGQAPCARAGAAGQETSGFNSNPRVSVTQTPVYVDGEAWYVAFSRFGALMGHNSKTTAPSGFTWRYDTQNKDVWINFRTGNFVRVTQLANADIYGKNLFGGFTTGEVYLSIFAENYQKSAARIEISQIDGVSGDNLTLGDYRDEKAPLIELDERLASTENTVCVAKGQTVSIFKAETVDVSGANLSYAVYYNYESTKRSSVFVKNGEFVAEREGTYTIVYTAEDKFGNKTVEYVYVNCIDIEDGKTIDISVDRLEELKAGYEIEFPECTLEGLNGEAFFDIYVVFEGEKVKIQNGKFMPLRLGEYTIVYEYYDLFNNYEFSYKAECVASDAVKYLDEPYLPRFFLKDAEYSLTNLKAYTFTQKDATAEDSEFFVSFDGGEYHQANADSFVITGNENVRVKFVCKTAEWESSEIKIVDVGFNENLKLSEYFQGDFSAEENSMSIRYNSNKNEGNNTLEFVNALTFSNFRFNFTVPVGAYYQSLSLKLTDCYEANNALNIEFYGIVGGIGVKINGTEYKTGGTFADGEIKSIYYDSSVGKLVLPGGTAVIVDPSFKNDLFFLDVSLNGISGEAYLDIRRVNNQPFALTYFDVISPEISAKDISGKHDLGEKITLVPASYTDVISPSLNGKLTVAVYDPSNRYVLSEEGILLDGSATASATYTFTLKEYGKYRIQYRTIDQSGNEVTMPYLINVEDDEKPSIQIENEVITIKRLTVYEIKNYVVNDNITAQDKLSVTVIVMDKKQNSVISVGNEFEAKYSGEYTVYIYCTDEAGNSSYASFVLMVE